MSLIKATQRLSWRFGEGKAFTPNDADINALNEVLTWINNEKKERVNHNRHFGKIVIIYYCELLQRYSWDKFLAEKEIQQILETPLKEHYERFRNLMNVKEWYDSASVLGLSLEHVLNGKTPKEIESIKNNDRQIIKENQKELLKSLNPWGEKEITNKLNHFLSELLNKYGNLE